MKKLMFTVELDEPDITSDRYWRFYDDGTFLIFDQDGSESLFQTSFTWRQRNGCIQYRDANRWINIEDPKFNKCYHQYLANLVTEETCEERSVRQGAEVSAGP